MAPVLGDLKPDHGELLKGILTLKVALIFMKISSCS